MMVDYGYAVVTLTLYDREGTATGAAIAGATVTGQD